MKYCMGGVVALIAGTSLVLAACSTDNGGGGSPDASTSSGRLRHRGRLVHGRFEQRRQEQRGHQQRGHQQRGAPAAAVHRATAGAGGKTSRPDGGVLDGGGDSAAPDGGNDAALIARGDYLVNAVALCGGCHTDRTNPTAVLGGNKTFRTGLPAPNLTSDDTGLGSWSDAQIKRAFTEGLDDEDKALNPTMPYQLFTTSATPTRTPSSRTCGACRTS